MRGRKLVVAAALLLLLHGQPAQARPAGGCRSVTISGVPQDRRCTLGRCSGWLRTSSGTNGTQVLVRGWWWRPGQVVSKTILVCDQ